MVRFILIVLVFINFLPFAMADDNCDEARKYYRDGVNLLRYHDRKAAFEKAVKLCPTYAEAFVNLADAYENLGEFEEAEKYYRQAISIKPDLFVPFLGLGELYLKSGRYKDSHEAFVKGLEIKPNHEMLKAGINVAAQRVEQGVKFLNCDSIKSCLDADETFQLMCMCPGDRYEFLRKRICVPNLNFISGTTKLTWNSKKQLIEIGKALQSEALSKKQWLIVGHADNIGSPEYNLELSRQRSEKIRNDLINKCKLDKNLLNIKFLGQIWPMDSNASSVGRSNNRRVEIILDE